MINKGVIVGDIEANAERIGSRDAIGEQRNDQGTRVLRSMSKARTVNNARE